MVEKQINFHTTRHQIENRIQQSPVLFAELIPLKIKNVTTPKERP
jgi:hypothetical protein